MDWAPIKHGERAVLVARDEAEFLVQLPDGRVNDGRFSVSITDTLAEYVKRRIAGRDVQPSDVHPELRLEVFGELSEVELAGAATEATPPKLSPVAPQHLTMPAAAPTPRQARAAPSRKRKVVGITMLEEDRDRAEARAEELGLSLSSYLCQLIRADAGVRAAGAAPRRRAD
jgi:hypothetical protein